MDLREAMQKNSASRKTGGEMPFRVAADEFLRFCAIERRLSRHTLDAYSGDLTDFQNWLPRGALESEISATILREYLEEMIDRRNLSTATVRRRLACLRAFFRHVGNLNQAPSPFATWTPQLPRRKRLPRTLSRGEAFILLSSLGDSAGDALLRIIIRLMIATGIRVGELCTLRTADLSPDGSVLRIHGKGSRERT